MSTSGGAGYVPCFCPKCGDLFPLYHVKCEKCKWAGDSKKLLRDPYKAQRKQRKFKITKIENEKYL